MRILMLTQWFDPEPFFKGLPFAKALAANGHEVEVLTGFPNYPGGKIYPGYKIKPWLTEMVEGIRVHRVALYPSHDKSGLKRILNYLSFAWSAAALGPWLVRKPDIIYVYNLVTLGTAAKTMRLLNRCPIVVDVLDLWPESVSSSGMMSNGPAMRILRQWCNGTYKSADHLTVISPGFKQNLESRGIPGERIDVIHNWCDEQQTNVPQRDDGLAKELGLDDRFNVMFAGTMGQLQALDSVIDAAKLVEDRAPRVQFVFIGGGVEVENLKAKASGMGLSNVLFLPRRPVSEIGAILQLADVLLVHLKDDPLFRMTIPSKTQAYMAAGKPILMGVNGDAADLVEAAEAGITCRPEDPESIAVAVLKLSGMPAERLNAIGMNGRKFYESELSLKVGVKKFEQLFKSVIDKHN